MSILTENHIVNQAKYIQMQATDIPVIKTLHKTKSMPITTETDCMQNITNNTSQKWCSVCDCIHKSLQLYTTNTSEKS